MGRSSLLAVVILALGVVGCMQLLSALPAFVAPPRAETMMTKQVAHSSQGASPGPVSDAAKAAQMAAAVVSPVLLSAAPVYAGSVYDDRQQQAASFMFALIAAAVVITVGFVIIFTNMSK